MIISILVFGLIHLLICALGLAKTIKIIPQNPLFYGYLLIFALGLFIFIIGITSTGFEYIRVTGLFTWWFGSIVWFLFFMNRRPVIRFRFVEYIVASFIIGIISTSIQSLIGSYILNCIIAVYLAYIAYLVLQNPLNEFQIEQTRVIVDYPFYMKYLGKPTAEEVVLAPSLVQNKLDLGKRYLKWSCFAVLANVLCTFLSILVLVDSFFGNMFWILSISLWVVVMHMTLLVVDLESKSPKVFK